jgi:hypothetical protein
MEEEVQALVVDNGSGMCKAGNAKKTQQGKEEKIIFFLFS